MSKLFFWVGVFVVVMIVLRLIAINKGRQQLKAERNIPLSRSKEPMVRCAHCGIYLPRSEAYLSHQHTWCSPEHAKLGMR